MKNHSSRRSYCCSMMMMMMMLQLTMMIRAFSIVPSHSTTMKNNHRQVTTTILDNRIQRGSTDEYEWAEDLDTFEIEIRMKIPNYIGSKDIQYKADSNSIDLRYKNDKDEYVIVLDSNRKFRYPIDIDGTYWNLEDPDTNTETRTVVVTIEKKKKNPGHRPEVWDGVFEKAVAVTEEAEEEEEEDEIVEGDTLTEGEKDIMSTTIFDTFGFFPDLRTDAELPKSIRKMRQQPRPKKELEKLKAKYNSMDESDAAYAMLVDLGLMEDYSSLEEYSDDFDDDDDAE
mmetsp:Transcript_23885/g.27195  ORF Transcript_23885/g.27195 Transcript_23885/m.27195 type:complete len:284 (+) Transcript_23885:91-942(+)